MFGPRDGKPVPEMMVQSMRYVREGKRRFLVINLGEDGWIRAETNARQCARLVEDIFPDVLVK